VKNHFEISEDNKVLTKYVDDPIQLNCEIIHTQAGIDCASNTMLFRVPKILSYDEKSISFEYIYPSINYKYLLLQDYQKARMLGKKIVDIILFLQEKLSHKNKLSLEQPIFDDTGDMQWCYVHGDFSMQNILVAEDQILLIDWVSSRWIDNVFNFAPKHWDFLWFVQSLLLTQESQQLKRKQISTLAREMIYEYLKKQEITTPIELAAWAINMNTYLYHNQFLKKSRWYSILKHHWGWAFYRKFWKKIAVENT